VTPATGLQIYSNYYNFVPTKEQNLATRNISWPQNIHKMCLRLGSALVPAGGTRSTPPHPLSGLGEGKEWRDEKRGREGWEGKNPPN